MVRALVLGAVQGLTEFVPVSSSAHLVLVPFLLRWPIPDLTFDVAVHIGTALALVVYFARDLAAIVAGAVRSATGRGGADDRSKGRLLVLLAIGTIPAAIAGVLLEATFEDLFTGRESVDDVGAPVTAGFLVVTAILLWAAEAVSARRGTEGRGLAQVNALDALLIGALQAAAIAPGISRSGATISAGMFRGLTREAAARFSFLLSLPAIVGAAVVALPDLPPGADLGPLMAGAAAAAVFGFAAVAFLLRYLRTRTMRPFAAYCVALAAVALAFWSQIN
ncbi:MAG TPA: undecaprenyl-diphosphate phosphatase [Actinomycetota bacterium]|nr:undecaprenyl-diphosphate phosphatase [Actinomycetota bacterium]